MPMATVNVSFPNPLLKAMDATAHKESRSRSELLRAAVSLYLERKERWERLLGFWRAEAKRMGLKPEDVNTWVAEYRREHRRKS
jgi:Arc/MetJ-type ribon-helix-helix transcriptional regulator